ncbi:MAG: ATPase, T2SS/T4P/T4SS family [Elusimicrobiota bacterium]|nr:ATPase, T2SS/T4P/T4SS family [Elusimicrobiota bacterium]
MMRRHHGGIQERGGSRSDGWMERELPGRPRILVVEDEPELRASIMRFLDCFECEVAEAGSGREALEAAARHSPELIILDFGLPDFNGFELLRRFRSQHEFVTTPMLMLTGTPRAFALAETFTLELSGLVKKPATSELLYEEVCRALGGRLARRAGADATPETVAGGAASAQAEAELKNILDVENRQCEIEEDDGPTQDSVDAAAAEAAPVIKLVNAILSLAVEKKASDIHIEPLDRVIRVRFRMDGALVPQLEVPASMGPSITARLKVMAHLDIAERRVPQDGRFRMYLPDRRRLEIRLSTLPSRYGEKVVMRLLGQASLTGDLSKLNAHPRDLQCITAAIENPNGLILVTGPTGSGKTTTLYRMLAALNTAERNIVTAEDPVEYELPGITQVSVRNEVGLTFEKALRAFLRQDPDVILVGEIRDLETASIALKASVTGHLVLSTLHTNDSVTSISRLVDMGVPPYLVAAAVRLIVAQRLVRVLCAHCKRESPILDAQKRFLAGEELIRFTSAYAPVGCMRCDGSGYKGRVGVMEVLPVRTAVMREAITRGASPDALQSIALADGLRPLRSGALDLVERGVTSLSEALKILVSE